MFYIIHGIFTIPIQGKCFCCPRFFLALFSFRFQVRLRYGPELKDVAPQYAKQFDQAGSLGFNVGEFKILGDLPTKKSVVGPFNRNHVHIHLMDF